jgi:hypothetical protein
MGYRRLRQRVIEPTGEAKSGYTFLVTLAKGMGYGDLFPATDEERPEFAFETSPVSLEELRTHPEGVKFDAGTQEYRK